MHDTEGTNRRIPLCNFNNYVLLYGFNECFLDRIKPKYVSIMQFFCTLHFSTHQNMFIDSYSFLFNT